MNELPLAGRRALVTGSTGGIGLAIAERLAAEGSAVMLHGLAPPAEGEAIAHDLATRHGVTAAYARADISRPEGVAALTEAATQALGGPALILVNNAVVRDFGPVEAMATETWDLSLAVNLSAPFHAIRLLLPGMRAAGWGRIVNISSAYGLFGTPGRAGYVTTKTALIGLTRAVAMETARTDITCNALCPGSTPTPAIEARLAAQMAESGLPRAEATEAFLAGKQPSGRFVAPEHLAAMVGFLCGPAGAHVTGAALPMDGGWSAS